MGKGGGGGRNFCRTQYSRLINAFRPRWPDKDYAFGGCVKDPRVDALKLKGRRG